MPTKVLERSAITTHGLSAVYALQTKTGKDGPLASWTERQATAQGFSGGFRGVPSGVAAPASALSLPFALYRNHGGTPLPTLGN
jgi:hypothetical protein